MDDEIREEFRKLNEFQNETRQEFQKLNERFDKVDARFDKLESDMADGFEKVDGQLQGISAKVEALENEKWNE